MSRYETPATIAEAIEDFRTANAAIRKIRRNDGRTAATTKAIAAHQKIADRAMRSLMDGATRAISGDLTEEQHLIERLADGNIEPKWREVLEMRLAAKRQDVRRWARVIGSYELAVSA